MPNSPAALVIATYCHTHNRILSFVQKLADEQLHFRIQPESHPIAWHAWHLGRWADHLQATIPGMTAELQRRLGAGQQIWYGEKLAERWGFDNIQLGFDATGMNMSDEIAAGLIFPRKEDLLNYVESAFDLAERAVTAIDDEQFGSAEQPQPMTEGIWGAGTVGDAIIAHLTHDNRHLGMMECLLGLQGQRGTATQ